MRIEKRRAGFVAAAALTAVLTCLPQTGWMVRQQLRVAAGGALPSWASGRNLTIEERAREKQTADARPGDFPIQLAMAFEYGPGVQSASGNDAPVPGPADESKATQAARTLVGLRGRFPGNPSLNANVLRYLCSDAVRIHRESETAELEPADRQSAVSMPGVSVRPQNTAEYLRWYDEAAAAGEREEPGNGYFPAMRAIGLFAAHRDAEAFHALHLASAKTEWNEHSADEVRGNGRLVALTYGEPGSLPRLGQMASLLFFHYAPLRNVVRLATVEAMHREINGQVDEGFALRHDIARLGVLIRTHSAYSIGAFVGGSMCRTAGERPGGLSAARKPARLTEDAWRDQSRQAYCGYLQHIGRPGEAAFIQQDAAREKKFEEALAKASVSGHDVYSVTSLVPLAEMWMAGTALLSATLVLLMFGAVCSLLRRSRLLTHKAALPTVLAVSFGALFGCVFWLGDHVIGTWFPWVMLFQGISSSDQSAPIVLRGDGATVGLLVPALVGTFALGLPVFLAGIASRRPEKQTVPGAAYFVRRYAALALPAATALLAVYAVVVMGTLTLEIAKCAQLNQALTSETRYLAAL